MKKKKNLLVMIFAILKTFLSIILSLQTNTLPIFDSYLNSGPLFFVAS